jgi:acetyl-CoA carboxylase carboxyltransferase component
VELAVMGGGGAVNVLYKREIESAPDPEATRRQKMAEYAERFSGPFEALQKQYAQAVIRPAETRRRLIQTLRILAGKREDPPPRKHGVMPV